MLLILAFQNDPKVPPSLSQAKKRNTRQEPYKQVVLNLFKNINFDLIFIMYGK